MSQFSDYMEDNVVNWLRGTTMPVVPANFYIALYTATPSDSGGGTEVTGGSYARVAMSPAVGTWDATVGGDGHTQNTAAITFPTASASWGTVTSWAMLDASSGGNLIFWGALDENKTVGSGDTFEFAIGALDITIA